jgi:hypothetical protein
LVGTDIFVGDTFILRVTNKNSDTTEYTVSISMDTAVTEPEIKVVSLSGTIVSNTILLYSDYNADIVEACLLTLGYIDNKIGQSAYGADVGLISQHAYSQAAEVRDAALKALRYIGTKQAKEAMLDVLRKTDAASMIPVIAEISYTRDENLILDIFSILKQKLCKKYLTSIEFPVQISILLTPKWVADNISDPDALFLANRFGYLEDEVYDSCCEGRARGLVREILGHGVGIVTSELLDRYKGADTHNRRLMLESWQQRILGFEWSFMSDETLGRKIVTSLLIDDSDSAMLEKALLFAALRKADISNIEARTNPRPFDRKHEKEQAYGRFFYVKYENFDKHIQKAVDISERIFHTAGAEAELKRFLMPYMVVDYLSAKTETREEELTEEGSGIPR